MLQKYVLKHIFNTFLLHIVSNGIIFALKKIV